MMDPILSIALAIHSNPGVYAFLIGSGVSRAAKIPTGWEIVEDLSAKLATLLGEEPNPNPAAWYHGKFKKDPDYAELLNDIAKTPAERQQLLRSYFEPSEQERSEGFKQPTRAHRAIAKLVASAHVRVILTTNFDRLIEQAIQDEGIAPTVISTPDAVDGALPLVHQKCCVIKLHGDYLDVRIKNAPAELASYDERTNRLLDQVLDQFGLVVCGWSAQWDTALRAAIERCPNRRFSTFWVSRSEPNDMSRTLIQLRAGQTLTADDAEMFFPKLAELVFALDQSKRPHPASVEVAIQLTKRYLVDDRHRIELDELVSQETARAHDRIAKFCNTASASEPKASVSEIYGFLTATTDALRAILAYGAAYGEARHDGLWVAAIERIAHFDRPPFNNGVMHYPFVLVSYCIGLPAIHRGRYELVLKTMREPRDRGGEVRSPLFRAIDWGKMHDLVKQTEGHGRNHTPISEYVFTALRESMSRFFPDRRDYEEAFDRYEYCRALVYIDLRYEQISTEAGAMIWAPLGRFCYKAMTYDTPGLPSIDDEIKRSGAEWPPLKVGLFRGSLERLQAAQIALRNFILRLGFF